MELVGGGDRRLEIESSVDQHCGDVFDLMQVTKDDILAEPSIMAHVVGNDPRECQCEAEIFESATEGALRRPFRSGGFPQAPGASRAFLDGGIVMRE